MAAVGNRWLDAIESRIAPPPAVHWFERWEPVLDEALHVLPPLEHCPAQLLRDLFEASLAQKRIALVLERDEPIAVVPLKTVYRLWRPLTTWILPGTLVPARPGETIRALAALGTPVFVQWWRQGESPPSHAAVCDRRDIPAHRLECVELDEAHWRKSGLLKSVRRSRKRCAHLRTEINRPGAAQWTIERWGRHWASDGHEFVPGTAELIAVARYWEPRGRHVTVSLTDGDDIAAAVTLFVHGRDLIAMCNYRRREYDELMVGTRVLDAAHEWALANGKSSIDFGSEHAYLKRWAPENGTVSEFLVATPESMAQKIARAASSRLSVVRERLNTL